MSCRNFTKDENTAGYPCGTLDIRWLAAYKTVFVTRFFLLIRKCLSVSRPGGSSLLKSAGQNKGGSS